MRQARFGFGFRFGGIEVGGVPGGQCGAYVGLRAARRPARREVAAAQHGRVLAAVAVDVPPHEVRPRDGGRVEEQVQLAVGGPRGGVAPGRSRRQVAVVGHEPAVRRPQLGEPGRHLAAEGDDHFEQVLGVALGGERGQLPFEPLQGAVGGDEDADGERRAGAVPGEIGRGAVRGSQGVVGVSSGHRCVLRLRKHLP